MVMSRQQQRRVKWKNLEQNRAVQRTFQNRTEKRREEKNRQLQNRLR